MGMYKPYLGANAWASCQEQHANAQILMQGVYIHAFPYFTQPKPKVLWDEHSHQ